MKDHEKRELVDALTKAATEYGQTQQLRARIAELVLPALAASEDYPVKPNLYQRNEMQIEHKLIAAAIAGAVLVMLSAVAYNVMDSQNRIAANLECVAANERMADMMTKVKTETLRITSLPTCPFR